MLRQLSLHDPFLNQFVKGMEIWGSPALGVAFCVHSIILEGSDLSLKLLVEQLQIFLLVEDVVTFECHLSR